MMQIFQKGSPVARDFSKAILRLLEDGTVKELEDKWLKPDGDCHNNSTSQGTESLRLASFWVLYVIYGATSTICFLLHTILSLKSRQTTRDEAREGNANPGEESR